MIITNAYTVFVVRSALQNLLNSPCCILIPRMIKFYARVTSKIAFKPIGLIQNWLFKA